MALDAESAVSGGGNVRRNIESVGLTKENQCFGLMVVPLIPPVVAAGPPICDGPKP